MFILSIIPIPLSTDSDGNTTNNTLSTLASAQQRLKEVEALYTTYVTGIIMDQNLYYNRLEGVDYSSTATVKQALDSARAYVQQLITEGQYSGTEDMGDISARIQEVQTKLPVTDQRIADLTNLLNALNNGTTLTDSSGRQIIISGVDNTNPLSVQAELDKALSLKTELTSIQTFWQSLLTNRQTANKVGDFNFDGIINNNDIIALQGALASSTQLDANKIKAGDMNGDGVVNSDDLSLLTNTVNPQPNQNNTSTSTNTNTSPLITNVPTRSTIPNYWQLFAPQEQQLMKLDDLKMTADIESQIAQSEQTIKYLEGNLQSLNQSSSLSGGDQIVNEISTTEKQLNREKTRYSMLKGLSLQDS